MNINNLLIGSILHDLIDKSLSFLGFSSGRGVSHSLLFILVSFLILSLISKSITFNFSSLIGLFVHILLDFPSVPLLYPFLEYDYIIYEDPLKE